MIGSLILTALVVGIAVAISRLARQGSGNGMQGMARRLVIAAFLAVLVVVAAAGVAGILGRLLDTSTTLAGTDRTGLARSLSLALIGSPIALGLWWYWWKRIDEQERGSPAWCIYVAVMSVVAVMTSVIAIGLTVTNLISGDPIARALATGIVWAGVWAWHQWMARHPTRSPRQLGWLWTVPSATFGLVLAIGASIVALGTLLDVVLDRLTDTPASGADWWNIPLTAAIWSALGIAVWWWHWYHDEARNSGTPAAVAVLAVGIGGGVALTIGGLASLAFTVLRVGFGAEESLRQGLEGLAPGLAITVVGWAVWAHHRIEVRQHGGSVGEIASLITSGVALLTAASGLGVVLNAALATFGTRLAGSDARSLLFGGLSALLVGIVVWWWAWRPTDENIPERVSADVRLTYLVVVFGGSAIAALLAIFTIGFRLFEAILDTGDATAQIDRFRASVGVLVASGLVALYHFPIWRAARDEHVDDESRRLRDLTVIGPGLDSETRRRLYQETGASVTLWLTDGGESSVTTDQLISAAKTATGDRAVVVVDQEGHINLINVSGVS